MKSKTFLLSVGLLFVVSTNILAQNTTGKKIDRVGENIDKTNVALEKGKALINNIFKKKQKDTSSIKKEAAPSHKEQGAAANQPRPDIKNPNELKPGDVSPDAVVLDVDNLFPFYEGAAMIQKGNSTALINSKGEYIIPFNQYQFSTSENKSKNGFFLLELSFSHKDKTGFVNAKGKYIDLQEYYGIASDVSIVGDYLRLVDRKVRSTFYFVDRQGIKYKLTQGGQFTDAIFKNGLVLYTNNRKYGYKDIKNNIIINAKYDYANPFSDGAAAVGIKNEFGELKYGFIDTMGKQITPLQFSNPPENFSNGRAKVYYNDFSKYSFIDKTGQVVYTKTDNLTFGPFFNGFSISSSPNKIMDKKGSIYSPEEFLKLFGVTDIKQGSVGIELPATPIGDYQNYGSPDKIIFYFDSTQNGRYNGFVKTNDGNAIYGKFSTGYGTNKLNFIFVDPISKLAYAIFDKTKNPGDVREGYINENGIFMIVKGKASKW